MSREIKFRGKSKRTGQWIYGDLLTSPNGLLKYIVQKSNFNGAFLENLAPEEVEYGSAGEYTGLKDKNGKEICEGDILKASSEFKIVLSSGEKVHEPNWEIMDVIFHEGAFKTVIVNQFNRYFGKLPSKPHHIHADLIAEYDEVIGNIYENPELLEDKNV